MSTYRKKFSDEIRGGCRGHVDFKWESIKNDKDREHYLGQSLHNNPQWWGERFTKKSLEAEKYREQHSTQVRQAELEDVKAREQQLMDEALGLRPKSAARPYNPRGLTKYDVLEATRPGATAETDFVAAPTSLSSSSSSASSSNPDRVPGIGYGELWRPGRNQEAPTRLEAEKPGASGMTAGKSLDEALKDDFVKVDQGIKNFDNDYGISNGWSDEESEGKDNDEVGEWKVAPKKIDLKSLPGGLKRKISSTGDGTERGGSEPAKKERKRSHNHHHHRHHHSGDRSHSSHCHDNEEREKEKKDSSRHHSHHSHRHYHSNSRQNKD